MDSLSPFLQDSFIPYFMPVYPGAPQSSTGPRTPDGKNKVRLNAVKHGLSGRTVILEESEAAQYELLLPSLIERYSAVTPEETDIVAAIRDHQWRLDSIPAMHINLLTLATDEHLEQYEDYAADPKLQRSMARVAGYRANMRLFEQFSRHEGRLYRAIQQLETRLIALIQQRQEQERVAAKQTQPGTALPIQLPPAAKQTQPSQYAPRLAPSLMPQTRPSQPGS